MLRQSMLRNSLSGATSSQKRCDSSGRNLLQPAPVVGAVENDVQAVLQPALVGHLGQQAVAENAPHSEKAGAGQDAAVGEKVTRRRVAMKCTTWWQKAVRRAGSATRRSSMAR